MFIHKSAVSTYVISFTETSRLAHSIYLSPSLTQISNSSLSTLKIVCVFSGVPVLIRSIRTCIFLQLEVSLLIVSSWRPSVDDVICSGSNPSVLFSTSSFSCHTRRMFVTHLVNLNVEIRVSLAGSGKILLCKRGSGSQEII